MIKLEHVVLASPEQMEFIIEGMRNPLNSWANFANVNNNGNTNYNNASNSNGVRPDSSINQRRRRCYPFRKDK